ncbi:MAG: RES domain-containing protein [Steroidobacteraceae bacterium]
MILPSRTSSRGFSRPPSRRGPPPYGSRLSAAADPGVWYGAEAARTAGAALCYWRWRFKRDSHGLSRLDAVAHRVFQATAAGDAIDLRATPVSPDHAAWSDPIHYAACQQLARSAR